MSLSGGVRHHHTVASLDAAYAAVTGHDAHFSGKAHEELVTWCNMLLSLPSRRQVKQDAALRRNRIGRKEGIRWRCHITKMQRHTALQRLVKDLPAALDATVFVVQHVAPHSPGLLAEILSRVGDLPVSYPKTDERLKRGRIYLAPADHHLILEAPDRMRVTRGPKENRARPAIDPLFRSAALAFGQRVIGVILTGLLDDGTSGLRAIKECGGIAIVQSPSDAEAPSMPLSALSNVDVDYCLPLSGIAPMLAQLTEETVTVTNGEGPQMSKELEIEVNIARAKEKARDAGITELGEPRGGRSELSRVEQTQTHWNWEMSCRPARPVSDFLL